MIYALPPDFFYFLRTEMFQSLCLYRTHVYINVVRELNTKHQDMVWCFYVSVGISKAMEYLTKNTQGLRLF